MQRIKNNIIYQKTDFNKHLICQLPNIFKCSKCKSNNNIFVESHIFIQYCLFCNNPNSVNRENNNKYIY
jgi:hypothetical protein